MAEEKEPTFVTKCLVKCKSLQLALQVISGPVRSLRALQGPFCSPCEHVKQFQSVKCTVRRPKSTHGNVPISYEGTVAIQLAFKKL